MIKGRDWPCNCLQRGSLWSPRAARRRRPRRAGRQRCCLVISIVLLLRLAKAMYFCVLSHSDRSNDVPIPAIVTMVLDVATCRMRATLQCIGKSNRAWAMGPAPVFCLTCWGHRRCRPWLHEASHRESLGLLAARLPPLPMRCAARNPTFQSRGSVFISYCIVEASKWPKNACMMRRLSERAPW